MLNREIQDILENAGCEGYEIRYFKEIDSTNTWLKKAVAEGALDKTVVIAGHQTAGRGRLMRSFESPKDKGLYLSVLLRPKLAPNRLLPITALAGVAVCNAVEQICGIRPALKWPNDLVLGNRKLCGILTEMIFDETGDPCVILGIGINVLQRPEDFSPEVRELATSLFEELGIEVSRQHLSALLIQEIERIYEAIKEGELGRYHLAYRKNCVNLGKQVQLLQGDGTHIAAEAIDIDVEFGLIVRTAEGQQRTVSSGEVSVRGLYGYID